MSKYTSIVYKHEDIKIETSKIVATNALKADTLLLIEHVFTGPNNICGTLIRNNDYMYENTEPRKPWRYEEMHNDYETEDLKKKVKKNCQKLEEEKLILSLEISKLESANPNADHYIHRCYSEYIDVNYLCVYSSKTIDEGEYISSIDNVNEGGFSIDNVKEGGFSIDNVEVKEILREYEKTEKCKEILHWQWLALRGLTTSKNCKIIIPCERFLNNINEKYGNNDIKNIEKYEKYVSLVTKVLLNETYSFKDLPGKMESKNIICLIASHINCNERLVHFHETLEMINQNLSTEERGTPTKKIYIGLSHDIEPEINIEKTLNRIKEYKYELIYNSKKQSQFEHYAALMKNLKINEESWLIFSDDDDIWSENRMLFYDKVVEMMLDPKIVCLKTQGYELIENKITKCKSSNYCDSCARYKYVKLFFEKMTEEKLRHKFCDVYFKSFLESYGKEENLHVKVETPEKLYIWRHVEYDRVCSEKKKFDVREVIQNNMDLYMALKGPNNEPNEREFLKFIEKSVPNVEIARKIYRKTHKENVFI